MKKTARQDCLWKVHANIGRDIQSEKACPHKSRGSGTRTRIFLPGPQACGLGSQRLALRRRPERGSVAGLGDLLCAFLFHALDLIISHPPLSHSLRHEPVFLLSNTFFKFDLSLPYRGITPVPPPPRTDCHEWTPCASSRHMAELPSPNRSPSGVIPSSPTKMARTREAK